MRHWAAWSRPSARPAARSSPCASRSPRSRTCSWSWWAAASPTRRRTAMPGAVRRTGRTACPAGPASRTASSPRPRASGSRPIDERQPSMSAPAALGGAPARDPRIASDWPRRRVAATNLRALVGRAYPRVRGMTREPSWVFFEILLPFLTTSAFVLVYRALQAPEAYIGFVVLGGAMSAFWLNVVWMMAGQLYWEKSQGNLELYFAAPMNLMAVLLGMAVGGLVMSSTRAIAVLVVASLVYGVT